MKKNPTAEFRLARLSYGQVKKRRFETAVLPWGATEPHGLHLPHGTDYLKVEKIAEAACDRAAARGARVLLLPSVPYGVNTNNLGFPFAMSIQPTTILAILNDLLHSLSVHGIRKVVIVNGHGGNEFKPLLRELFGRHGLFTCVVNYWALAPEVAEKVFKDRRGDHANEMETSLVLVYYPELVDMKAAGPGRMRQTGIEALEKGWAVFPRPWHVFTLDSGAGDPRAASAEKGRKFLAPVIERLADFLVELSARPYSKDFPYRR
ncbi:MAG TPA: creatininase family protein [bacterium]|uniref:Creatinine amidohydrolase n=1 Tax=candidate division TA06 bacterium ADurb.Bin417 TaxID=1852828 RepID=A0A1V5M9W7_UNCT6|nr:MAG: Creatinine amidohydrolase [candidate division TA06 bacterium ADurb.Bin417]HNQ34750.1 creatininase family protein [bacterium]HNS47900.1 creatininase family protein [bacterium]